MRVLHALLEEAQAWIAAFVFAIPGRVGQALRAIWAGTCLGTCGRGVRIGRGSTILSPRAINLGDGVSLGERSFFSATGGQIKVGGRSKFNEGTHVNASVGGTIEIGAGCLFGPGVVLRTANHRYEDPDVMIQDQGHDVADIVIGDDCWIAANVTLLPGVTLGRGVVVGAGAVVTRSLPDLAIAVGVPARQVGTRGGNET